MDFGNCVIVAALCCDLNGSFMVYRPTTLFDQQSCFKQAKQITEDWHARGMVGFAICELAKEEDPVQTLARKDGD